MLHDALRVGWWLDLAMTLLASTMLFVTAQHTHWSTNPVHLYLQSSAARRLLRLMPAVPVICVVVFELWLSKLARNDLRRALEVSLGDPEWWQLTLGALPSGRVHVRLCAAVAVFISIASFISVHPLMGTAFSLLYVPCRVAMLVVAHTVTIYQIRHTPIVVARR